MSETAEPLAIVASSFRIAQVEAIERGLPGHDPRGRSWIYVTSLQSVRGRRGQPYIARLTGDHLTAEQHEAWRHLIATGTPV